MQLSTSEVLRDVTSVCLRETDRNYLPMNTCIQA